MELERKVIIAKGRQLRSSWTIEYRDDLWYDFTGSRPKYKVQSTWNSSTSGTKMYQIEYQFEVYEWLENEHSQFGIKNPSWWKVNGKINITDTLFTLLTLKFSE